MNITLILGSIRPGRESVKPARYFATKLTSAGHTVDFIDLKELDIPLFNNMPEKGELPAVKRMLDSVNASDAIALVFPEYNHDVSSTMRNALSFLRKREFMHKPVGLVSVSNGQYGGVRALYAAKASFPTLGAMVMPTVVAVDTVATSFPDETTCTNPKIDGMLDTLVKELAAYAPALSQVRQQLAAAA